MFLVLHSLIFLTVIIFLKLSHSLYLLLVQFKVTLFSSSIKFILSSTKSHTGLNSLQFISLFLSQCLTVVVMSCCDPLSIHTALSKYSVIRIPAFHLSTILSRLMMTLYRLSLKKSFLTSLLVSHSIPTKCPIHCSMLLYAVHIHISAFSTAHKVGNIHCLYAYSQLNNSSQFFDLLILSTTYPSIQIKIPSILSHHYNYSISILTVNILC